MIDIERIIKTGIPDIAPVYGGVRGRTMSSRHQSSAWQEVVDFIAQMLHYAPIGCSMEPTVAWLLLR